MVQGGSAYLNYVDGNALDRALYLAMIVSGLVILARRAVRWRQVISQNPWLYLFMGYCAVSILWSDYPFVAMKRWVKDFGNVVMVLIVMTEPVPAAAMRSLLLRATYVLVLFRWYSSSTFQTSRERIADGRATIFSWV